MSCYPTIKHYLTLLYSNLMFFLYYLMLPRAAILFLTTAKSQGMYSKTKDENSNMIHKCVV